MVKFLTLTVVSMLFSQSRLSERKLADMAVIGVPRSMKEMYKGIRDEQQGRLIFTFSSDYFWASFGSSTAYKQQLFVSFMAPDATEAEYAEYPRFYRLLYETRKVIRTTTVGSGTLTIHEGIYAQNTLQEPSHLFVYVDRARRLQLMWHAVKKEMDLKTGVDVMGRMAASFRITRDPTALFVEMRDRPGKEAELKASNVAKARATLEREGFGPLQPGAPVLKQDVYVEWMSDPEVRYQLLIPLGRVRIAPGATPVNRPRPARLKKPDGTDLELSGTVGWREFIDGEWVVSNDDNAYLPFSGIGAKLAADATDPGFVYFYYSGTVRVEEQNDDLPLTSIRWFMDGLPEVRRMWREGKLVSGGPPAND